MGSCPLTRDQTPGPLHWKCGVLAIGPPGKTSEHRSDAAVSLLKTVQCSTSPSGRRSDLINAQEAIKATHHEAFLASFPFSWPEKNLSTHTHCGLLESVNISFSSSLFLDCISHPTATSVPTSSPVFQSPKDSSRLHRSHHLCEAFLNFLCRIITHVLLQALFHPLQHFPGCFVMYLSLFCTDCVLIKNIFISELSACCLTLEYLNYLISIC